MRNCATTFSTARWARPSFPTASSSARKQYEDFIQRNNMTVRQFEALEKEYILIRKLQALVSATASVPDSEVHDEFERRNTKIKFEYAVITQADILKGLHPSRRRAQGVLRAQQGDLQQFDSREAADQVRGGRFGQDRGVDEREPARSPGLLRPAPR